MQDWVNEISNKVLQWDFRGAMSRVNDEPRSAVRTSRRGPPHHPKRFSGNHHTAVMKIPTLEFWLTLENFAELCGCRQPDFLKNRSLLRLFQPAFYGGGNVLCSGLFVSRLSHEIALFHCLRAILRFSLGQIFIVMGFFFK